MPAVTAAYLCYMCILQLAPVAEQSELVVGVHIFCEPECLGQQQVWQRWQMYVC
jgi:hypothetical protein